MGKKEIKDIRFKLVAEKVIKNLERRLEILILDNDSYLSFVFSVNLFTVFNIRLFIS